MPSFVKPSWIDKNGWDENLKRQTVGVHHYATVGLAVEPGVPTFTVTLNDPSLATVAEQPQQAGIRVFKVTGIGIGYAMLEAKDASGSVRAFMQVQINDPTQGKQIVVDLTTQTLQAYESGLKVFDFECVTGASDHPTLPGRFHVFRKDRIHRSATYNAQMNYAMFFSADGKAIHQYHGVLPLWTVRAAKSGIDWFGSHGCVRLTEENAAALFGWAPINTPIQIK